MRRRGRLLVVMQQGTTRRLLAEALGLGGYDVRVAGGRTEELRPPLAEGPSLVLYDVSMPTPLRRESLRRIREWDGEARIVAFSDPATVEMARRARELGAREYVGDPFDLSTLLRVIAEHARPALRPDGTPAAASISGGPVARD